MPVVDALCFMELAECLLGGTGEPAGFSSGERAVLAHSLRTTGTAFRAELQERLLTSAAADGLRLFLRQQIQTVTGLGFRLEAKLRQCTDTDGLFSALQQEFWALTALLLVNGGGEAAGELIAYPAFSRQWVASLADAAAQLRELLAYGTDPALRECLCGYVSHMMTAGELHRPSYGELVYFDGLLRLLEPLGRHAAGARENFIHEQLLRHNFNHLGFLACLQKRERERLAAAWPGNMDRVPGGEQLLVFREGPAYDAALPGIRELLYSWRRDLQAGAAGGSVPDAPGPAAKLKLDLSVAHLACLLRTLHEAGVIAMPLSELFRAVPCCFSSRRRDRISGRSFNKEFYSVSQFTAARVRELLLRLAGLITARYFPVMAAIWLLLRAR